MAHNLCGVQYADSYVYTVSAYISCEIVAITVICCIHQDLTSLLRLQLSSNRIQHVATGAFR
jgi:hypothetical protein